MLSALGGRWKYLNLYRVIFARVDSIAKKEVDCVPVINWPKCDLISFREVFV